MEVICGFVGVSAMAVHTNNLRSRCSSLIKVTHRDLLSSVASRAQCGLPMLQFNTTPCSYASTSFLSTCPNLRATDVWQQRNQMICCHCDTNDLFEIRKKKQCRPETRVLLMQRSRSVLVQVGSKGHRNWRPVKVWLGLYWEAAAASSANITFTCTPACAQSLEKPRRTRAYREKDINHSCSQRWIQNADVGLAFEQKWKAPWCKSLIFRLKHWHEQCSVAAACLHAAFVSH